MRRYLVLFLLPLAACATPQEACISNATKDIRVLDKLIATTRGNVNRGYAIETQEFFETEKQVCGEVGGKKVYCDVAVADTRDVPVAIDLNAEQSKLNSLVTKRDQLVVQAESVIAQCRLLPNS